MTVTLTFLPLYKYGGIMQNSEYILEIKNVSKYFPGVQALDNAQLKVRAGTVHALVGENGAGKSTLMKCLFGEYKRDSGEIIYDGRNVEFLNTRQALDNGIAMVHQELNQVLERSVMENIWLGRFIKKGVIVNHKEMYARTKEIFESLSIDINPKQKLGNLSVSQRQLVEIAKALSSSAKIIVLDEATSSLTDNEVEKLFDIVNNLKRRNCGIVYISHKMEEIMEIADDVTVMRDGKWITTDIVRNFSIDKIISLMVGRNIVSRFPPKDNIPSKDILLRVRGLKGAYAPAVADATFELYKGEILGIAGLMGSKRTEVIETLFGIRKREEGDILIGDNKKVLNQNPRQSIKNGFALLTEERRTTGIFGELNIGFNSSIANIRNYKNKFGLVGDKKISQDTQWVIESLKVKTPSAKTRIAYLSGGNQQKVILGRWLLTKANILMLDEPTKGIDVGAKYEIYQLIINTAKQGKGIIFISSEMPELLGISDRIMVMSKGRVAGIVNTKDTNQEELMHLAAKFI